jgi:hypothetical protein
VASSKLVASAVVTKKISNSLLQFLYGNLFIVVTYCTTAKKLNDDTSVLTS